MSKFIQKAIKHPGRIKNLAKREGISTRAAASKASHSADSSLRAAGNLAKRFQSGGDLHQGGSERLKPSDMKYSMCQDRKDNLASKDGFKGGTYARDGKMYAI